MLEEYKHSDVFKNYFLDKCIGLLFMIENRTVCQNFLISLKRAEFAEVPAGWHSTIVMLVYSEENNYAACYFAWNILHAWKLETFGFFLFWI